MDKQVKKKVRTGKLFRTGVWVVHAGGNIYGIYRSRASADRAAEQTSYGLGCEGYIVTNPRRGVLITPVNYQMVSERTIPPPFPNPLTTIGTKVTG